MYRHRNLTRWTLVAALAATGCSSMGQPTHRVVLDQNAGLLVGDRVRAAGVEVGRVMSVDLDAAGDAVFGIRLGAGTPLFADATASISPTNSFGPRHLVLDCGQADAALPLGATIPGAHTSYDVSDMLKGMGPVLVDDGESLIPGTLRSLKALNWGLKLLAPLDESAPDFAAKAGKINTKIKDAKSWLATRIPGFNQNVDDLALWMVEQKVTSTLEAFDNSLAKTEKTLLPRLQELSRDLDALDASLDTALAKSANLDADLAKLLKTLMEVRTALAKYEAIEQDTIKVVRQTTRMLRRINSITESDVRQFFQVEGLRSRIVGMDLETAKELKAAGADMPEGGWDQR